MIMSVKILVCNIKKIKNIQFGQLLCVFELVMIISVLTLVIGNISQMGPYSTRCCVFIQFYSLCNPALVRSAPSLDYTIRYCEVRVSQLKQRVFALAGWGWSEVPAPGQRWR